MKVTLLVQKPTDGKWFEVNPSNIDRNLFRRKRSDPKQEKTRQLILEAFKELKKHPEKYPGVFNTMAPKKTWEKKSVRELKEYPSNWEGQIADWVEQALEWAQRIDNGESWAVVCNEADTASWYRLVVWKEGELRLVGGARKLKDFSPASHVYHNTYYHSLTKLYNVVPLVVLYED